VPILGDAPEIIAFHVFHEHDIDLGEEASLRIPKIG
jgi:hypothetical protein